MENQSNSLTSHWMFAQKRGSKCKKWRGCEDSEKYHSKFYILDYTVYTNRFKQCIWVQKIWKSEQWKNWHPDRSDPISWTKEHCSHTHQPEVSVQSQAPRADQHPQKTSEGCRSAQVLHWRHKAWQRWCPEWWTVAPIGTHWVPWCPLKPMKPFFADSPAWQPEWVSQLLEQDSLHRHTKASCICCNDGWGPPELHLQNAVPAQMANCWETVARLLEMVADMSIFLMYALVGILLELYV